MVLAKPERIEAQLFGPFADGQNFVVIRLIRPAKVGMVVAKDKDAEFHTAIDGSGSEIVPFLSQAEGNIHPRKRGLAVYLRAAKRP
jgi:hypothetical protein